MTGGWNVGIYKKTKDPALAWDLVDGISGRSTVSG